MTGTEESGSIPSSMSTSSTKFNFYNRAQSFYARIFDAYGRLVGRYPIAFIVIPLLTFGLLGLGLMKQESETEVEALYTPINSRAAQDRARTKAAFPDMTGMNYNTYSLNAEDRYGEVIIISEGNVFNRETVEEIKWLVERIKRLELDNGNAPMRFEDLCARAHGDCVISGEAFLSDAFLYSLAQKNVTYPIWNNMDISFSIAEANRTGQTLNGASMLKLTFRMRQDNETFLEKSLLWEDLFIKEMKNQSLKMAEISFATSQSLGDELNDNTSGDIFWFSLSFTLLITYASFVAGGDCVGSTSHLARAGVIAAGVAVLGALGFISLCGVKFVNIVGVMPFLVLGIGVDDMFLMLSAWAETNKEGYDIPKRVGHTFRIAGVGITITSLTDFCAFAMGYTSVFQSVKNFCIYTGTAVLFCYVAQATFFAGCLAIHGHRVENSRHCITCRKISPRDEEKTCLFNCCCSGRIPRSRNDSPLEKLMPMFLNKYLLTPLGKLLTLTLFAVYLGFSVWGITKLEQGLFLNNLVPPSSYFHTYSITNYEHYGARIPVEFIFDKQTDYSLESVQSGINDLFREIKNEPLLNSDTWVCWLDIFKSTPLYNKDDKSSFIPNLNRFLFDNTQFMNDVVFDSKREVITASRCYVLSSNVPDSMDQAELMIQSRAIADKSSLSVYAYHPLYIYFEQFVSVLPTVLQTVGIAVAVMVLITMILLPHPLIVLLVLVNIILIVTGVFGFMAFWELSLSSITMIHLIMSVGFSVDFTVHVCSAYMLAEGDTRNERAKNAIVHAAGPVFNAGFSSFLGIVMLVSSKSYVFQSFFRIMVLVLVFGLCTAALFLPVVLSLIGPVRDKVVEKPPISETVSTISLCTDKKAPEGPLGISFPSLDDPNKIMVKL